MPVLLAWGQAWRALPGLEAIREVENPESEEKGSNMKSEATDPKEGSQLLKSVR